MNAQYKCLIPLSMFYMTIKIITIILIYKIVMFGSIKTTAATLIIPLWFLTGDVIAEIYGYDVSKLVIWSAILFQLFFAFVCVFLIQLPSPIDWHHQAAYDQVFGSVPRSAIGGCLAILTGAFVNAYTLSKWKVSLKGKFFWLRSLSASVIGEAVFTFVAYAIEFVGISPMTSILELFAVSMLTKMIVSPILVIPSTFIVSMLKKIEGIDTYDYDLEFNPFKIKTAKRFS